jgi:Ca2+-binding EF-hand superfamily protein
MNPKDLRIALERFGGYKPKRNVVYSIFSEYDKDSSGELEFKEFL